MASDDMADAGSPSAARSRLSRLVPSLAANFMLPVVAYALVRPQVDSDATALVVAALFPAAWTVGRLVRRHRLDPLGVVSLTSLGAALLFTLASGGNPLLLKVQEAPVTGAFGLALLVSVAARRPLLPALLRLVGRPLPLTHARAMLITAIVGATLCVEVLVRLLLAVTLDTSTFLEVHRPVSWAIWAIGVLLLLATKGRRTTE